MRNDSDYALDAFASILGIRSCFIPVLKCSKRHADLNMMVDAVISKSDSTPTSETQHSKSIRSTYLISSVLLSKAEVSIFLY